MSDAADLFDEPAETDGAPSRQRERPRRGSGGGNRGSRSGGSPLQQPRIRLLIALGLLVVIVLILVSTIRGCQRDQLVDSYHKYLAGANQLADESQGQGTELRALLENKNFQKPAQVRSQVEALAAKAEGLVARAKSLHPPDRLKAPNQTLRTVLEYRALAFEQLPGAIDAAVSSKDVPNARTTISQPLQLLAASDVNYRTSFSGPTQNALQKDNIKDAQVNRSEFFAGNLYNKTSPAGAAEIIANLRQVKPSVDTGNGTSAGQIRGLSIVKTEAVRGAERTQLTPGATVSLVQSADLKFAVTVENGGDSIETNIDVKFTYTAKDNPQGASDTKTIPEIEPGEDKQVTLEFKLPTQPSFGQTSTIKVEVTPVEGEKSTANNVEEYPVEFSFQ